MRTYIEIRRASFSHEGFDKEESVQLRDVINTYFSMGCAGEFEYCREIESALEMAIFNRMGISVRVEATLGYGYYEEELSEIKVSKREIENYLFYIEE